MIGQTKEGMPQIHLTILSSVSEEYIPLAKITAPNKMAYAFRWGFGLHVGRHFKRDYDLWGIRQAQILNTLPMSDWLWFMGADTVITNMTIDARKFCIADEYDAVIAYDVNGINNDSWFIRNCPASYAFIERVLHLRGKYPTDQDAMKSVLGLLGNGEPMPGFRMAYVSQRLFNSYLYGRPEYGSYSDQQKADRGGGWHHGDFVVHFAGIDLPSRMVLAQQYLNAVVE